MKEKLTKVEKKEPMFMTLGRIRGMARNLNSPRLKLLVDKVAKDLDKLEIRELV